MITSYSIAYYVTTAGAPGALTMSVGGSATSGEIGTLMKYTEYSVYVVASTAVGSGDQSDTVTVFTDEDGEFMKRHSLICCSPLNSPP